MRTLLAVIGVALVAALVVTVGTDLGPGQLVETDTEQTPIITNGDLLVKGDDTVDDVWVGRGTVTVRGRVEDDIHVLNGNVRVAGSVGGDVVVYRGWATVTDRGVVGGDIRTSSPPNIQPDATVVGEVGSTSLLDLPRDVPRPVWLALWMAAGLAVLVAIVVLRRFGGRALGDARRSARRRPLAAMLLGLAVLVGLGALTVIGAASVIGLGVAFLAAAAALLLTALGAAVTAAVAAQLLTGEEPSPLALLAGWLALGAVVAATLLVDPFLALATATFLSAMGAGCLLLPRLGRRPDDEPVTAEPAPAPSPSRWRSAAVAEPDDEPVRPASTDDELRLPTTGDGVRRPPAGAPEGEQVGAGDGIERAVRDAVEAAARHDDPPPAQDRRTGALRLDEPGTPPTTAASPTPPPAPSRPPPAPDRVAGGPIVPPRTFRPANGPGLLSTGPAPAPTANGAAAAGDANGQDPTRPTEGDRSRADRVEAEVVAGLPAHVRDVLAEQAPSSERRVTG